MKNGLEIDESGNKVYYLNGQYHREDGPAIEYTDGDKFYLQYGKLHRIDGPASIYLDEKEWHFQGEQIFCKDQQEFERLIKLKVFW